MTIRIKKAVKRKTDSRFRHFGKDARLIVVSIEPGDVLGFRLLGTRTTYWLGIAAAMDYAVKLEVARRNEERRAARRAKRVLA